MFDDSGLTIDAFLGGRLRLWQPRKGYRAGVDPVLLAASVPARAGQTVLDLGCGVGTAGLCLAARVPGIVLTGVERHAGYADLARRNAAENACAMQVHEADIAALPADLRQRAFDHVIVNPPYHDRAASTPSARAAREAALGEDTGLPDWVDAASRRLAPRGLVTFVHRAERLPDLLAALHPRLGSIEVLPLAPRVGRAAHLVLVRARKEGRAPFRLHAPMVLHAGARHVTDGDSYTPEIEAVLRAGEPLPFPP